jgi:hypothetical protein
LLQRRTDDSFLNLVYRNGLVYWSKALFDRDLNFKGYFKNSTNSQENIYDVSLDGKLAAGWSNLFDAQSRTLLRNIPASYNNAVFISNRRLALFKVQNPIYQEYSTTISTFTFIF